MTEVFIFIVMLICGAEMMIILLLCKDIKRQADRADAAQKELVQLKNEKYFAEKKHDIMQEVFADAEKKNESLTHGTSAQRINAAADILCNTKRD